MTSGNGPGTGRMRIGAISDSHSDICHWPKVLEQLREAFAGVDLILHCGDISTAEALDDLEAIAPVQATRSAIDPPPDDKRIADGPRVVDVDGRRLVLAFNRPDASIASDEGVDLVVFGGTHAPSVETIDGVLWVNPGSPALAERTSVAIVTIGGDGAGAAPTAEIVDV